MKLINEMPIHIEIKNIAELIKSFFKQFQIFSKSVSEKYDEDRRHTYRYKQEKHEKQIENGVKYIKKIDIEQLSYYIKIFLFSKTLYQWESVLFNYTNCIVCILLYLLSYVYISFTNKQYPIKFRYIV